MHPRNLHIGDYPISALCKASPALKNYVVKAKSGRLSIDFADPMAVKALNGALLSHYYNVKQWDIPEGYLCPPVPGRADYIHGIANLLAASNNGVIPTGPTTKGLDVGTGANLIYPIIGSQSYGWEFVGSDIDKISISSAKRIILNNSQSHIQNSIKNHTQNKIQNHIQNNFSLGELVSTRLQSQKKFIFTGIIKANERFDFTMCNPPFHKSAQDALQGTSRKNVNLAKNKNKTFKTTNINNKPITTNTNLNFAGQSNELWCEGGELAFIQQMTKESVSFKDHVKWFTCLVSKKAHLKAIETSIHYYKAREFKTVDMGQGQKQSRFVAWTFS